MHVASPWAGLLAPRTRRVTPSAPESTPTSKAGAVRALLRKHGPMTAAQILLDDSIDIRDAGLLWALMKWDMSTGRVILRDGTYSLNADYDERLQAEISAAVKLLKGKGFKVEAPKC